MENIADCDLTQIILSNVLKNKTYANKIISEISLDFFTDDTEKSICETILNFHQKYHAIPTVQELVADMKENMSVHNLSKNIITDILGNGIIIENQKWLLDQTERFIKRKKTLIVFEKTFEDFERGDVEVSEFYKQFQKASSFSFDDNIGISLLNDAALRYDVYTNRSFKISWCIDVLDKVTQGGMEQGTLNIVMAGINSGKSLFMGDIAAKKALAGNKVLVISLEMAEIKLIERIESNLMNVSIGNIRKLERSYYHIKQKKYLDKIKESGGDIIFKQYPTKSANVNNFRNLLIECKNKLNYDFDLVVIDYLNICGSCSQNKNMNTYSEVKSIAEEMRALAIEFNIPILTATQVNRTAQGSTSLSMEDVAESIGLAATADFMLGLVATETMIENNQIQATQVKSRYGEKSYNNKFMLGLDRKYMRIFDIDDELTEISDNDQEITDQSFDLSALTG